MHLDEHSPGRTRTTVGQYLGARLRQADVRHLFGVPGDYNLELLDEILGTPGLSWTGSANELNAAYSADGYARRRGLGALVTTYGVGELSALNGIAGAMAESVPVVQITGAPPTTAASAGSLLHHTLADGDFTRFERMYREVTAVTVTLTSADAPRQIDCALETALRAKKPVCLIVPADVVTAPADSAALASPLADAPVTDVRLLSRFAAALRDTLAGRAPVILVGHLAARHGLEDVLGWLARAEGVQVVTMLDAKGVLSETHPGFAGTYIGAFTADERTRSLVESADVLITLGVVAGDLLTGMYTHQFGRGHLIQIGAGSARIDDQVFDDISMRDGATAVLDAVERPARERDERPPAASPAVTAEPEKESLTQARLWQTVQDWVPPETTLLADAGTAFYGAAGMRLPQGTVLIGQPIWSSIGYTLPAALGVALADPDRRTTLLIGDGAAQLTIQELANFIRAPRPPVIVLINNDGYTVERAIRSPEAVYQDIRSWDWTTLASGLLPARALRAVTVRTSGELRAALESAGRDSGRVSFIEAILDRHDTPPLLTSIAAGLRSPAPSPAFAS